VEVEVELEVEVQVQALLGAALQPKASSTLLHVAQCRQRLRVPLPGITLGEEETRRQTRSRFSRRQAEVEALKHLPRPQPARVPGLAAHDGFIAGKYQVQRSSQLLVARLQLSDRDGDGCGAGGGRSGGGGMSATLLLNKCIDDQAGNITSYRLCVVASW
jgi:hypothetical protein